LTLPESKSVATSISVTFYGKKYPDLTLKNGTGIIVHSREERTVSPAAESD
jgi:hypothetical protein